MTITTTSTADPKVGAKRGCDTRRKPVSVAPPAENIEATPTSTTKRPSKSTAVIKLLSRPKGATVPEVMAATDWQPHSVRAYLSGLRKKGNSLAREARKDGEQAYRLATFADATADQSKPAARSRMSKGAQGAAPTSVDVEPASPPPAALPAHAIVA